MLFLSKPQSNTSIYISILVACLFFFQSCVTSNVLFQNEFQRNSGDVELYTLKGEKFIDVEIPYVGKETLIESDEAVQEMDKVLKYLLTNRAIRLRVMGSGNSLKESKVESTLAYLRSQKAIDYLVSHGVHPSRLEVFVRKASAQADLHKVKFNIVSFEHIIIPDDKISISIWDHPDLSIGSIFGIYNANEVTRKWVLMEANGEITVPLLGKVHLQGLTTKEAASKLSELYSEHIVDPRIVVQVLNREVTILGEINLPGIYTLEKERNSLIELIGRSGGFKDYANKKMIKILRKNGDNLDNLVIDLTDINTFKNKDLNLHSGDIIYVVPLPSKRIENKAASYLPFASILSSIVLAYSIISTK